MSNTLLKSVKDKRKQFDETIKNVETINKNEMQIVEMEDSQLLDDPKNKEIYGEDDLTSLVDDIKEIGFIGTIVAYKDQDKYRIISGHRRRNAAKKAGITKYKVVIQAPPANQWVKDRMLIQANLHNRRKTPMIIAREIDTLFASYKEEQKENRLKGSCEDEMGHSLIALVANQLEISSSQVSKYKSLLKLEISLQELADNEKISWSALAGATKLSVKQQRKLAESIKQKIKTEGYSKVTRTWIELNIKALQQKTDSIQAMPETTYKNRESQLFFKNCGKLEACLKDKTIFQMDEIPMVVSKLKELQEDIVKTIQEFENAIDPKG